VSDLIERAKAALEGATPGPWIIPGRPDKVCSEGYTDNGAAKQISTANRAAWMIASHPDQPFANARLIALAPDLARALIETTAERDALRVLLVEARDELAEYANADWPEPSRSQYPDIMRRWKRDMDLCWRIDAALQEDTPQ